MWTGGMGVESAKVLTKHRCPLPKLDLSRQEPQGRGVGWEEKNAEVCAVDWEPQPVSDDIQ